jgi:transposase
MKRDRPGDDLRRLAVEASLQGMSYRKIAQRMGRSRGTINRCLASCGRAFKACPTGRSHKEWAGAVELLTVVLPVVVAWSGAGII